MTYMQLFNARVMLTGAQLHISQAGIEFDLKDAQPYWIACHYHEAFKIIGRAIVQIDTEFEEKRQRVKERRKELRRARQVAKC